MSDGDENIKERLCEALGWIVSGYYFKGYISLVGESNSGKKVFLALCRSLVGEQNCCTLNSLNDLSKNDAIADFLGMRLCTIGDHPDEVIIHKAIGSLKALTGNDAVRGRQVYKQAVTFVNEAPIVVASNRQLQFTDSDGSLKNRIIIIPFLRVIPTKEQDPDLNEKLYSERGGIIFKACSSLRELSDGKSFTEIDNCYYDYLISDTTGILNDFVSKCCKFDPTAFCSTDDLYNEFTVFCNGNPPYNKSVIGRELSAQFGLESWRTNSQRGFKGITLA